MPFRRVRCRDVLFYQEVESVEDVLTLLLLTLLEVIAFGLMQNIAEYIYVTKII